MAMEQRGVENSRRPDTATQNDRIRGCRAPGFCRAPPGQADLTGVASAGLRDVALIHGLSAGHTPRFVLRKERMRFRAQAGMAPLPMIQPRDLYSHPSRLFSPGPHSSQAPSPFRPSRSFSAGAPPAPRSPAHNRPARPALLLPHWRFRLSKPRPLTFARLQRLLRSKSLPLSNRQQRGPSWPRPLPPHLAAATAEPVAAHGVVSQGALLAAVPARSAALLRDAGRRGGRPASPDPAHLDPPSRPPPRSLAASRHRPLTCTEPQSHSSPASTKPFPHSGGSSSWTGTVCQGSDWDSSQASLPRSPPLGRYLEGLVEEAAPAALLQKLVVLIDAAARELAGQVEPGQARGAGAVGSRPAPSLPAPLFSPFSRLGMGCTGDSVTLSRRLRICVHGDCTEILLPACQAGASGRRRSCPLPARTPRARSWSARREQGFGGA